MLGRVDPQGSLLETRHVRRNLVTKGSFYEHLADHGHEVISDEDFAHLYAEGKGPALQAIRFLRARARTCVAIRETPNSSARSRSGGRASSGGQDVFRDRVAQSALQLLVQRRAALFIQPADHSEKFATDGLLRNGLEP